MDLYVLALLYSVLGSNLKGLQETLWALENIWLLFPLSFSVCAVFLPVVGLACVHYLGLLSVGQTVSPVQPGFCASSSAKVLVYSLFPFCSFQIAPCQRGRPHLPLPTASRDNGLPTLCFQVLISLPFLCDHILFRDALSLATFAVLRSWTRIGSSYLGQLLSSVAGPGCLSKGLETRGEEGTLCRSLYHHHTASMYQDRCVCIGRCIGERD